MPLSLIDDLTFFLFKKWYMNADELAKRLGVKMPKKQHVKDHPKTFKAQTIQVAKDTGGYYREFKPRGKDKGPKPNPNRVAAANLKQNLKQVG